MLDIRDFQLAIAFFWISEKSMLTPFCAGIDAWR
jgi:hypothetical protein